MSPTPSSQITEKEKKRGRERETEERKQGENRVHLEGPRGEDEWVEHCVLKFCQEGSYKEAVPDALFSGKKVKQFTAL